MKTAIRRPTVIFRALARYTAWGHRRASATPWPRGQMSDQQHEGDAEQLSAAEFVGIVERHQRELRAFLCGFISSPEQSRDLVQDTFTAAWRAAQSHAPPFAVSHGEKDQQRRWLFAIAYRRAISTLRRRRLLRWESLDRSATLLEIPTDDGPAFDDRLAEGEALRAALNHLDPRDVACLLLRVVQGFSAAEVGEIVGATPNVVTKRLSRAKQRLRAAYLAENASDGR